MLTIIIVIETSISNAPYHFNDANRVESVQIVNDTRMSCSDFGTVLEQLSDCVGLVSAGTYM